MLEKRYKKYEAFSLVEMLIAIAILSIIMLAAVMVFSTVVKAKKNSVMISSDIGTAREALELMAKDMRMSSQLDYIGGDDTKISFRSNSTNTCVSYWFDGNSVESAFDYSASDCSSGSYSYSPITESDVEIDGKFVISPTNIDVSDQSNNTIGKGTILITVDGKYDLQTTVSFRDYNGISN